MAELIMAPFLAIGSALGGGGAAVGAGGAAGAAAGAAGSGLSLASILQGGATVLGVVSTLAAGQAEADRLEQQAADAHMEQQMESLQGIDRRTDARRALVDAIGAQDVSFAASGVDLSFGTAAQARSEAFEEFDRFAGMQGNVEIGRSGRLGERAANYRRSAKRAKGASLVGALGQGLSAASSLTRRY